MSTETHFDYIVPEKLMEWIESNKRFFLIHTLTKIHFDKVHLPGARNACVFEVTFLEQMNSITNDTNAEIVLYGSSKRTMDALTAAEKLQEAGYQRIMILKGGIEHWRSLGYPMEGESKDAPIDPETRLMLPDGKYRIDKDQSLINWIGRNPNTKHFGTVRISEGQIEIENGNPSGVFEIDMNSIDNMSLKGDDLEPVLVSHLKSEDFFLVKLFPTAQFIINGGNLTEDPYVGSPNYKIEGMLVLRGVQADLSFLTTLANTGDNGLVAEAHFDIDRTRWKIIYGSTRFFEHLGMHLVFDLISFEVKIVALREGI